MEVGLLMQYVAIALAVVVSALVVFRKQFPRAERAVRARAALWLLQPGRGRAAQRLGRWLAPPATAVGACGGCDSCGPKPPRHH